MEIVYTNAQFNRTDTNNGTSRLVIGMSLIFLVRYNFAFIMIYQSSSAKTHPQIAELFS